MAAGHPTPQLPHFPVALFASVMGIGGLSLAWRRAHQVLDVPPWPSQVLFWLALVAFLLILALYASKWVRHPQQAIEELRHPIKVAFASTPTVSLLILATAGQSILPDVARVAWWIGALGQLAVTFATLNAWYTRPTITLTTVTPAWFIPVVGNLVTALAARHLGSTSLGWLAFSIGITFWLALLPLLLHRLLIHETPIPPKLHPTLAIFIAPPAVGLLAWQSLTGDITSPFAIVLFSAALGFLGFTLTQTPALIRHPFDIPYWATTFPAAAIATAALAMLNAHPSTLYHAATYTLLGLTTLLVLVVTGLTLRAVVKRKISLPD